MLHQQHNSRHCCEAAQSNACHTVFCTVQTLTWNGWMVRCEQVLKVLDHNQQQQGCSTEEQKNNTTLACQAKLMLIQNEVKQGRQQEGAAHGTHAPHQAHHIPQHCKCLQTVHPDHGTVCTRRSKSVKRRCTVKHRSGLVCCMDTQGLFHSHNKQGVQRSDADTKQSHLHHHQER